MSIEPHELRTMARERREKLGRETKLSKALDDAANEIDRLRKPVDEQKQ
jgi:phage gp36-like protein